MTKSVEKSSTKNHVGNYRDIFLRTLKLGKRNSGKRKNISSRQQLYEKRTANYIPEKTYTLRKLFTVIEEDGWSDKWMPSIISNSNEKRFWEYANRYFRAKFWYAIDVDSLNNDKIDQDKVSGLVKEDEGNNKEKKNKKNINKRLDKEFSSLIQICKKVWGNLPGRKSMPVNRDTNHKCDQGIDENELILFANKYVEKDLNGEKFSLIDLINLRIFAQIIAFINVYNGIDFGNSKDNFQEAIYYIAYYFLCAYSGGSVSKSGEALFYGERAIKIQDFEKKQKAFLNYGASAIDAGFKQLAYDIYYTYIKGHPVGKLNEILKENELCDFNAGKEGLNNKTEAEIFNNYSYVCSEIALVYGRKEKKRKDFYEMAVENMKIAIDLYEDEACFYCTYGDILCENVDLDKDNYVTAKGLYEKYGNCGDRLEKIDALRSIMTLYLKMLLNEYKNDDVKDLKDIIDGDKVKCYKDLWTYKQLYQKEAETHFKGIKGDNSYIKTLWLDWKSFFEPLKNVENNVKNDGIRRYLIYLLLMIQQVTLDIKEELKWKDYISDVFYICNEENQNDDKNKSQKIIAYYTTLGTATHLFDEMVQDDEKVAPYIMDNKANKKSHKEFKDAGINCMTVMHAKYMNDPYEGLTLLNALNEEINKSINDSNNKNDKVASKNNISNVIFSKGGKIFREGVYDQNFMFLKSFTEAKDVLALWNRYASDVSMDGKDSNGCFIELDNKEFSRAVSIQDKKAQNVTKKKDISLDDYNLYRVVYINKDGEIKDDKNPNLTEKLKDYYDLLKKLMKELNRYLNKAVKQNNGDDKEEIIDCTTRVLQESLKYIVFLFKEDDYADELESRMVLSRNADQQQLIRILSSNPPKLCINPFFQIYVHKVILGPNVRSEDEWKPYFQYQLNNMWNKNPDVQDDDSLNPWDKYEIKDSEKHYRTFGNGK